MPDQLILIKLFGVVELGVGCMYDVPSPRASLALSLLIQSMLRPYRPQLKNGDDKNRCFETVKNHGFISFFYILFYLCIVKKWSGVHDG